MPLMFNEFVLRDANTINTASVPMSEIVFFLKDGGRVEEGGGEGIIFTKTKKIVRASCYLKA